MLFKISLKNIKKSTKDYAIYFFTLILGVSIFYIFNALESQTVMMNVSKTTYEVIELMNAGLSAVSVFVSIVLGSLIIYASRFLIKRRNKEFGIYLTLGMSKRKMSMILFIETLIIGVISLVIGLFFGILLSQLMSVLVSSMFKADMSKFKFIVSNKAIVKTCIYFGIMYFLVMVFNTIQVGKCKLIDLLYASKKSENLKLKNPILSTIIFIISCIILGIQYYKVSLGYSEISSAKELITIILLGAISTFFIFWSLSGLLIRIFTKMKKTYYKGLNSFTLRQFSSKINTMVLSMTIICLMLFVTICLLASSFSMTTSLNNNFETLAPADLEVEVSLEGDYSTEEDVITTLKNNDFDTSKRFKDYITYNSYKDENLTLGSFLGEKIEELQKQYAFIQYDTKDDIITISDYNKIAKILGHETLKLNDDEYILVADFKSMVKIRNEVLKENKQISVNGTTLKPKYTTCIESAVNLSANHINTGIFVVPDNVVDKSMIYANTMIANYNATDSKEKEKIDDEISKLSEKLSDRMIMNSKLDIEAGSIGIGAMTTFICLYLGIIFLIASAAILSLKELTESADNIERFNILRKIGADEKMINKALFRQIGIFFIFPLLVALIHSFFGIRFATNLLEFFGNDGLLQSIISTSIIIIFIYGGYFLITYLNSKNIIKEKR